ncbi:MAG: extracellular solute-binding protein [Chloroflexi bacterium]|nr:MAG: extracellular solute-binding protein [Chloroflexota bacterium]
MRGRTLARLLAGALLAFTACEPGATNSVTTAPSPPTRGVKTPSAVGVGEGELDLITWEGYADDSWTKPFTQQSGCQVHAHYVGSTAEMSSLMAGGGGGQWDMVSAPGDISLQLIYGGEVNPMNVALMPSWPDFGIPFQSPAYNTVGGVHYGVSLQWSANILLYNTKKVAPPPTSWSTVYDPAYKDHVTVPDNPMQIADAALYLSRSQPSLGITNPFELNRKQFNAAVGLLTQQRPLIHRYWAIASDEVGMYQDGEAVVGSAGLYQALQLQSVGIPVAEAAPREGMTAWGDSWMLAARAPHPNCAYLWAEYTTTPQVQAQQAHLFGETPVNSKACGSLNALEAGSCAKYHADATASYLSGVSFWQTPIAYCAGGGCVPYDDWVSAWDVIKA